LFVVTTIELKCDNTTKINKV